MDNPIRRSAATLSEGQIAEVELELGLDFPDEYRNFLLEHNGGMARRNTFYHTNKKGSRIESWLGWIFCIGHEGKLDPVDSDLMTEYKQRPVGLPKEMLPVAYTWFMGNDGKICLCCDGPDAGKVFLRPNVDPEKTTVHHVADSWSAFLNSCAFMDGKEKKWKTLIQEGDADGLRELLEKKSKWKENYGLQSDIEQEAIEEGHWGIVELLLEKGWSASDLFTRALGSRRFDLARGILWSGKVADEARQEALTNADGFIWYLPDFVAELVEQGADIDFQTSTGATPLHQAVEARSAEGVRFLLERGANPTAKNDDGRTPAALAQRLEEPALLPMLREAEEAWRNRPKRDASSLKVSEFNFHGVTMTKAGPSLTLAEIAEFEDEVGLEFPPEYRGFLLKSNGGTPDPDRCLIPSNEGFRDDDEDENYDDEDRDDADYDDEDNEGDGSPRESKLSFCTLLPNPNKQPPKQIDPAEIQRMMMEGHEFERPEQSVKELVEDLRQTGNPRRMLPIGFIEDFGLDGGYLLMSCKGNDKGRIYYRDGNLEMHEEGASFVADSLGELFRLLGEAKSRPASPNEMLERAIQAGDLDGAKAALAHGAKPMKVGRTHQRPLDLALQSGSDAMAMLLIDTGVDMKEVLPLVANMGRLGLLRELIAKTDPSRKMLGEILACDAVVRDAKLVKELLDRGASVKKSPVGGGWTPLLFAAGSGSIETVRLLLDAQADPNAKAESGQTPLSMAATNVRSDAPAILRLLLERGAKINAPDMQGETALHQAVRRADLEAATILMEAGEDLHARHKLSMPGMSEAQQEKMARQAAKAMEQMMAMFSGMNDPDEDNPPPPDDSTPMGEMLAKAQEAIQSRMGAMMPKLEERMQEMAQGGIGKGRSAAQVAEENPAAMALLPQLEDVNARCAAKRASS